VLIAIFGLAYYAYRRIQQISHRQQHTDGATKPKNGTQKKRVQTKIQPCHYCKVHLPEQNALNANNKWYCSQEHYLADQDSQDNPKNN
jgi:hypothetical protein